MSDLKVNISIFDPNFPNEKVVNIIEQKPIQLENNIAGSPNVKILTWASLSGNNTFKIRQVDYLFPKGIVDGNILSVQKTFNNQNFLCTFWATGEFNLKLFLHYKNWEEDIITMPLNILKQIQDNKFRVEVWKTEDEYFYHNESHAVHKSFQTR